MNKQRKVLITTTYNEMGVIIDTKTEEVQLATDTISRQAAIDAAKRTDYRGLTLEDVTKVTDEVVKNLMELPSAQPTLYGYKIEHLAYIARVMEKEGITAEQAVNSFDELGTVFQLITEEVLKTIEEAVMK